MNERLPNTDTDTVCSQQTSFETLNAHGPVEIGRNRLAIGR